MVVAGQLGRDDRQEVMVKSPSARGIQQEAPSKRLLTRGFGQETAEERPPRRGCWKEASNKVRGLWLEARVEERQGKERRARLQRAGAAE